MDIFMFLGLVILYHIEQAERVEEASLGVLLHLLYHLLLLWLPSPHLRLGEARFCW